MFDIINIFINFHHVVSLSSFSIPINGIFVETLLKCHGMSSIKNPTTNAIIHQPCMLSGEWGQRSNSCNNNVLSGMTDSSKKRFFRRMIGLCCTTLGLKILKGNFIRDGAVLSGNCLWQWDCWAKNHWWWSNNVSCKWSSSLIVSEATYKWRLSFSCYFWFWYWIDWRGRRFLSSFI